MPSFSKRSKAQLATCHPKLQILFSEVIKYYDCTIIEGFRDKEAQNKAFKDGFSDLQWPHGNHNKMPSLAVDVMPYPIDWQDLARIREFADFVKNMAIHLDINVQWGGDWKHRKDMPHWEVKP